MIYSLYVEAVTNKPLIKFCWNLWVECSCVLDKEGRTCAEAEEWESERPVERLWDGKGWPRCQGWPLEWDGWLKRQAIVRAHFWLTQTFLGNLKNTSWGKSHERQEFLKPPRRESWTILAQYLNKRRLSRVESLGKPGIHMQTHMCGLFHNLIYII